MVIKIEKKLSKTGKEYVGLWFENWLVTIDRRAIYKLVPKDVVKHLEVGDYVCYEAKRQMFSRSSVDDEFPM